MTGRWWWAVTLGLTCALPLRSQEPPWNIQFSAFGTVGAAESSTNQVGFRREITEVDGAYRKPSWSVDTRFGAQMSIKLDPTLFATFQAISKYRYDGTYKPDISNASLTWNPMPGLQVRGGVINFHEVPSGEYIDAGYTYLWVRPPVECFGISPITKFAGVDLIGTIPLGGDTSLEPKIYVGRTLEKSQIDHVGPFNLSGGKILGGWLRLLSGAWRIRLGAGVIRTANPLPDPVPAMQGALRTFAGALGDPKLDVAASNLDVVGTTTWGVEADVVWEDGPHQGQALISSGSSSAYLSPGATYGYISYGYRIRQVVPYVLFSRIVSNRIPRMDLNSLGQVTGPMAPLAQGLAATINAITDSLGEDQHTLATGLRWDFATKADLKFQVERVHANGTAGLFYVPNPQAPFTWNGRMWVYSVTMDFVLGGGR